MQPKALLILSLALGLVSAQDFLDFDQTDFPAECADPCSMIATAEDTCDNQNDDDDAAQLNCVCTTPNMDTMVPECLSCLADFRVGVDSDDDDTDRDSYEEEYRDLNSLLSACSFAAPSQSLAPLSSTVYTTTVTTTDDDGEVETDTDEVTSYFTGAAAAPTSTAITTTDDNGSTTVLTTTTTPTPTSGGSDNTDNSNQAASSSSPNAAPAVTAAPLAAAGLLAAMMAL